MDTRVAKSRKSNRRNYQTQGNLALAPMPKYAPSTMPKKLSNTARKNREKAAHMSPGYILFLAVAMTSMLFACAGYIKLRSEITGLTRNVTRLESTLQDVTLSNDEEYARIMGAVDLESVKQIAMEELGMSYPDQAQVVKYIDHDSDYVRQFGDIPD